MRKLLFIQPTEDQAAVLLNELDKKGYKWASGIKLTDATIYEKYREKNLL